MSRQQGGGLRPYGSAPTHRAPQLGGHPPPTHRSPYVPPRPERPLGPALAWTALFSALGILAVVLTVLGAILAVLGLILWLFGVIDPNDPAGMGQAVVEFGGALAGPVALVVLLGSVVAFLISAVILLLLRISDGVRRWHPALQGLLAAVITHATSVWLVPLAASVVDWTS